MVVYSVRYIDLNQGCAREWTKNAHVVNQRYCIFYINKEWLQMPKAVMNNIKYKQILKNEQAKFIFCLITSIDIGVKL